MLFKIIIGERVNIGDIIKRINDFQSNIKIYLHRYTYELNNQRYEVSGYFTELENIESLMRFVDLFCHDCDVRIEIVTKVYKQVIKCDELIREYIDAPMIIISA